MNIFNKDTTGLFSDKQPVTESRIREIRRIRKRDKKRTAKSLKESIEILLQMIYDLESGKDLILTHKKLMRFSETLKEELKPLRRCGYK